MKSARRRSRELLVQGLYQWLLAGGLPGDIERDLAAGDGAAKADLEFLHQALHGVITQAPDLEARIAVHLDRPMHLLSPVERGVLLLAAWEFVHLPETPYRVIMNEAIELTKVFGGTDGHKFVNGVLDRLGLELRPGEGRARGEPAR